MSAEGAKDHWIRSNVKRNSRVNRFVIQEGLSVHAHVALSLSDGERDSERARERENGYGWCARVCISKFVMRILVCWLCRLSEPDVVYFPSLGREVSVPRVFNICSVPRAFGQTPTSTAVEIEWDKEYNKSLKERRANRKMLVAVAALPDVGTDRFYAAEFRRLSVSIAMRIINTRGECLS